MAKASHIANSSLISEFGLKAANQRISFGDDHRAMIRAVQQLMTCHPHHFVVLQDYRNSIACSAYGLECLKENGHFD